MTTPRLRPWRVIFPDGSSQIMLATSRTNATLTAQELCPGFVRIQRDGDW
jgi:hypothetical protein